LVDVVQGNPVQQLFTGGLAISTILVWIVFFANLLNMYLVQLLDAHGTHALRTDA